MTAKKILIVDDDKFLLDIYSTKFRNAGYEVDIAMNGNDAIDKIKDSNDYNFVLMDVAMPVLSGFETIEKLKEMKLFDKFPIIMLTNAARTEELDRGDKLGVTGYVIKSQHTPSEVITLIESIIKNKQYAEDRSK